MKVAPVRIVADWLAGLTVGAIGVNAKLATIPRDAGDPQPSAVQVYDETRDTDTALSRVKAKGQRPSVQVQTVDLTSPLLNSAQAYAVRDYEITIGIRITRTDDESEKGTTALDYTHDAVLESLAELHKEENVAARTRAGVTIEWASDISSTTTVAPNDDDLVTALIVVKYQARYIPA